MTTEDRSYSRIFLVVLITALIFGLWLLITNAAHGGIASGSAGRRRSPR